MNIAKYRYFVFADDEYYPVGSMGDCQLKTNSLEEAIKLARELDYGSIGIYDVVTDDYVDYEEEKPCTNQN
ncbi:hypothetical protein [Bacillus wiedmannii]|uniref:hypothetical protein n=1 Tax=Bacillus wiedmannii TaxID=1890302 RepID=UPI000BF066BF|nr:hypothetical protein [Bacillus wiedmannii]PEM30189.1 hypothetical protein CN598_12755 [Bacillus wiedmannii]